MIFVILRCSVAEKRYGTARAGGVCRGTVSRHYAGESTSENISYDRDRTKYLEILANLKTQYSFRIPAYVLMVNHVHLLLESGAVPLSRIMQRLGSGYTQYFNRRHRQVGVSVFGPI